MLFGFAIMTAFVPGIVGLASNTSWAVMWLATPLLLLKCKIGITSINMLGVMFLSYSALSLLWFPHGLLELMQLLALASVFVWGLSLKDLKKVTIGLSLGLSVSSIIAVLQYFEIELFIYSTSKVSGLFINSNIYAEISGMLLILILIYKLWWFVPITIPGLLVSSRAVMLGLIIVGLLKIYNKSKLAAFATAMILSVIASFFDFDMSSVYQRLDIWKDTLSGLTLLGHGIGSFVYVFPEYNKHLDAMSLAEYAHNDLLQLVFELGIGSVFLIFIISYLLRVDNELKQALTFFIVIGIFGFPLHTPITAFMLAIVSSQLAKHCLGGRSSVNSSRLPVFNRMETIRYS